MSVHSIRAAPAKRTIVMLLTDDPVSAQDALKSNLVNRNEFDFGEPLAGLVVGSKPCPHPGLWTPVPVFTGTGFSRE